MSIKEKLQSIIIKGLKKCGYPADGTMVGFSNLPDVADFQYNGVFALAKKLGKNPAEIAGNLVNNLQYNKEEFNIVFCPPAFINIKLLDKSFNAFANAALNHEQLTIKPLKKTKTILLDYGGANIAKELHVGHLRSPIIGESLKRLNVLLGNTVISDTHLGDWGLQMGMTIVQLEEEGFLGCYFGKNEPKPVFTLDLFNDVYPRASKRSKTEFDFKIKADEYTLFIQQKKQPYYNIYKELRKVSEKAIRKNYKELNAEFDLWYGESTAEKYIKRTVKLFTKQGLTQESNGALIVDVALPGENVPLPKKNPEDPNEEQLFDNPMPPAIIQKYNGGALYVTTDLATIYMRNIKNAPDELMYITDNRQGMHFKQVFRCAKMAGVSPKEQTLTHISFGTMNGKDGKPFKTRDGGMLRLQDIIDLLKTKAQEKLTANGLGKNDKLALQIGVAAMKYGDLSNQIHKDYVFDLDKFTSFEGKTGPYLQYTAARIKSLLKKAGNKFGKINVQHAEEKQIVLALIKMLDSYSICYKDNSLCALCLSVYNLAAAYSAFYNNVRILTEPDAKKRLSYLGISQLVLKALEQALNILAIDIPNKM